MGTFAALTFKLIRESALQVLLEVIYRQDKTETEILAAIQDNTHEIIICSSIQSFGRMPFVVFCLSAAKVEVLCLFSFMIYQAEKKASFTRQSYMEDSSRIQISLFGQSPCLCKKKECNNPTKDKFVQFSFDLNNY